MSTNTSTEMPKGITRSYGTAFRQMIAEAAARTLTIKDLEDLDSAEIPLQFARGGLIQPVELEDGAP